MADNREKTVQDVIDSMTDEQKQVMYFIVGQAIKGIRNKKGNKTKGDKK